MSLPRERRSWPGKSRRRSWVSRRIAGRPWWRRGLDARDLRGHAVTRLFICTPTHYLQGGVERILESLAELLPPRGFELTFGLVKGARFHDPGKFRRAFPAIRGIEVDGTSGTAYGRRRALHAALAAADP